MLDRLAQLIVDRLEPKIERIVQVHIDELRIEVTEQILKGFVESANATAEMLPELEKRLKKEITQQIVRGVKL